MKLKYSKQREAIKDYLISTHDHPSAEMVYDYIRRIYPNISLGTVYRNLSLLSELGEIRKVTTPGGPDRFDAEQREHYHFTCMKCGKIFDIYNEDNLDLGNTLMKGFTGKISGQDIQFYGICPNCCDEETE